MLNEKRVKHMVKLALYESRGGEEEIKASSYYKKDYVSFHVIMSVIWLTVAHILLSVLIGMACIQTLVEESNFNLVVTIVVVAVAVYILLLILYLVFSRKFYKKKHARAYHRVKKFKEGLNILEDMYREEKENG